MLKLPQMVEKLRSGPADAVLCADAADMLVTLSDALEFYAQPENYHAVAFMADRPAGEFADDFDKEYADYTDLPYDRPMPGKHARATFRQIT